MTTAPNEPASGDLDPLDVVTERFRVWATDVERIAPLYSRFGRGIADDRELAAFLLVAPAEQRLPVLLFAAVHWLLLRDPSEPLRRFYPNLAELDTEPGDPFPPFREFCLDHADQLRELIATRTTQTNEVGRCAVLLPALALVEAEQGPLAMVDVGSSGGLNLLLDRYAYRYEPGGTVGGPSTVELVCATRGAVPVPARIPEITARIGLDRSPIDLTDDDAASWLEACVWPDQAPRFHRLEAAIAIARAHPPALVTGDAVGDLATTIDAVGDGHPVVTNTWVLNYLSAGDRSRYVAELDRIGASRDVSWIYAESPVETEELPWRPEHQGDKLTVLTLVTWRDGDRNVRHLARTHPHGAWIGWY